MMTCVPLIISVLALIASAATAVAQWMQKNNAIRLSLIEDRLVERELFVALSEELRSAMNQNANNFRTKEDACSVATNWFFGLDGRDACMSLISERGNVFTCKIEFVQKVQSVLGKARYMFKSSVVRNGMKEMAAAFGTLEYYASENAGGLSVLGDKVRDIDADATKRTIVRVVESAQRVIEKMDSEMKIV